VHSANVEQFVHARLAVDMKEEEPRSVVEAQRKELFRVDGKSERLPTTTEAPQVFAALDIAAAVGEIHRSSGAIGAHAGRSRDANRIGSAMLFGRGTPEQVFEPKIRELATGLVAIGSLRWHTRIDQQLWLEIVDVCIARLDRRRGRVVALERERLLERNRRCRPRATARWKPSSRRPDSG
jgi:hypothetical protein